MRYVIVSLQLKVPVILFDFHNCEHLAAHAHQVDEIRHGIAWLYFKARAVL